MDCYAVFIFLFLLSAETACGPVTNGAFTSTVQQMQKEIQTVLFNLTESALPPNFPCPSINTTELVGPEQQRFTAHHLSSFRCHMMEMSTLTLELEDQLLEISEHTQRLERLMSGQVVKRNCSLPAFEKVMCRYVYVKCLLELLDQQLSSAMI